MPLIPKKIHFTWVSKPVPREYLISIINLAILAKRSGFELNLWVDKETDFLDTLYKKDISIDPNVISTRLIKDLFKKARNDPFYKTDQMRELGGEKQLESCIGREAVGFENPGARKDLLAAEILRQEGGYFFDADTLFVIKFVEFLMTQLQADNAEEGFIAALEYDKFTGSFKGGSDILASIQNNDILKEFIIEILSRYKKFDEHNTLFSMMGVVEDKGDKDSGKHTMTLMDKKRKPQEGPPELGFLAEDRFNLTIRCSGPEALCDTLKKYVKTNHVSDPNSLTFPRVKVKGKRMLKHKQLGGGDCYKVAGIIVQSVSDQNWVKQEKEKMVTDSESNKDVSLDSIAKETPVKPKRKMAPFEHSSSAPFFSRKKKAKPASNQSEFNSNEEPPAKKAKLSTKK